MKKMVFIAFVALLTFACKDDNYATFGKKEYFIHYDESVELKLLTSEPASVFTYYVSESNVASVSPGGKVSGVFVGSTAVVAEYNGLVAKCTVTVTPYERLFLSPLLNISEFEKNEIKLIELRNLIDETTNSLTYAPLITDEGIDSLTYTFENNTVATMTAFLKTDVATENVELFLKERFEKTDDIYNDYYSEAQISYNEAENTIVYRW